MTEPVRKKTKQRVVASREDLDRLEESVVSAAGAGVAALRQVLVASDPLVALAQLRFTAVGRDPLQPDRTLNLVEQLNQTFTCLASIAGARWLLGQHPDCAPFELNIGTQSGSDIRSKCGRVVAETFAATHPASNDKLKLDIAKVKATPASHRYVFYLSPVAAGERGRQDVTVVRVSHPAVEHLRL